MNDTWLAHHGIKGQKWGVRRYQNSDGSLTEAGKKKYMKSVIKAEKGGYGSIKKHDSLLNKSISDEQKQKLNDLHKAAKKLGIDGYEAELKLWDKVDNNSNYDYSFEDALRDNPKLAKRYNAGEKAFLDYDKEAKKVINDLLGEYGNTKINSHGYSITVGERMYRDLEGLVDTDWYSTRLDPKFDKRK